ETTTTTYEYDKNDRLLNETTGNQVKTYDYDDNGSLTSESVAVDGAVTKVQLYEWDDEGRLVAVETQDGDNVVTDQIAYQYDMDGLRVVSEVNGEETRYILDTAQPFTQVLEEVLDDGTVAVSYVYGNDLITQIREGEMTYYLVDALGSTRLMTDEEGTVIASYDYDAFGEVIASTGNVENDYLFTGEQFDSELDEYYLRARYYDPTTGRFDKRDFYEGRIGEPVTMHKYIYTHQNPATFTDPSGLFTMGELQSAQKTNTELQKQQQVSFGRQVLHSLRNASKRSVKILKAASRTYTKAENTALRVAKIFKIPILIYGRDMGFTTLHVGRAITGFGFTANNAYTSHPTSAFSNSLGSQLSPVLSAHPKRVSGQWYRNTPAHAETTRLNKIKKRSHVTDEYPYATTWQGAHLGSDPQQKYLANQISLMTTPAREQSKQGLILGGSRKGIKKWGKVIPDNQKMSPQSWYLNLVSFKRRTRVINRQGITGYPK
ncbi:MAG: RHS repeat-associated core domain-containing protein, partial [Cyanothece sp. SIO2G6]|nr:RHS repeat-associated core domain-containing protein [Cyanothece sp. SIO2G6]